MGRVKLQIKKIENTTNRQVTFSKRRNGLIKKAYELSVLCDVDVALIMFSPSGRLSMFSGNKSIEDVVARYLKVPEHERGKLHNQECIQRAIGKVKTEGHDDFSQVGVDSQVKELHQEMMRCKSQLEDAQKRLRMYEGNPWEIETVCEADYRAQILEEALEQVRARKHILDGTYGTTPHHQQILQVKLAQQTSQINGFAIRNPSNNVVDHWLSQRNHHQMQPTTPALNFLNHPELLPLRDDQTQGIVNMLPPQAVAAAAASLTSLPHTGTQPEMHNKHEHGNTRNSRIENDAQLQPPQFGQINLHHVNPSPWAAPSPPPPYATGSDPFPGGQPREGALLELFLSQLTPVDQEQIQNL